MSIAQESFTVGDFLPCKPVTLQTIVDLGFKNVIVALEVLGIGITDSQFYKAHKESIDKIANSIEKEWAQDKDIHFIKDDGLHIRGGVYTARDIALVEEQGIYRSVPDLDVPLTPELELALTKKFYGDVFMIRQEEDVDTYFQIREGIYPYNEILNTTIDIDDEEFLQALNRVYSVINLDRESRKKSRKARMVSSNVNVQIKGLGPYIREHIGKGIDGTQTLQSLQTISNRLNHNLFAVRYNSDHSEDLYSVLRNPKKLLEVAVQVINTENEILQKYMPVLDFLVGAYSRFPFTKYQAYANQIKEFTGAQ